MAKRPEKSFDIREEYYGLLEEQRQEQLPDYVVYPYIYRYDSTFDPILSAKLFAVLCQGHGHAWCLDGPTTTDDFEAAIKLSLLYRTFDPFWRLAHFERKTTKFLINGFGINLVDYIAADKWNENSDPLFMSHSTGTGREQWEWILCFGGTFQFDYRIMRPNGYPAFEFFWNKKEAYTKVYYKNIRMRHAEVACTFGEYFRRTVGNYIYDNCSHLFGFVQNTSEQLMKISKAETFLIRR